MSQKVNEGDACAFHPRSTDQSSFERKFSTGELPVEPNRYHYVWAKFCPWATPVAIMIDYTGLSKVISKFATYPLRHPGIDDNWFFGKNDNDEDPILHTTRLSENYQKTDPSFSDRPTVPALIDLKTGGVVNNSSQTIMNELGKYWKQYFSKDVADVYPTDKQDEIDAMSTQIITDITSVPGKITEATSQSEYDKLAKQYFDRLDALDQRLADQRFLMGDTITLPDFWLVVSLIRFDLVFYYKDKLNQKRLDEFPNLWRYARECYQIPAFKHDTDFKAIKQHFFQISDDPVTSFDRIIPVGPDESRWEN